MTTPITIPDVLSAFVEAMLFEVNTTLPAIVTSVDYSEGVISAVPLIKDKRSPNKVLEYKEIGDIPLWSYSGQKGVARVTVPVVIGDIVAIHFSQREASSFILGDGTTVTEPIEYSPLGLYPLYATPSVHPIKVSKPIDPVNVCIENGATSIKVTPTGEVIILGKTTFTGDTKFVGNVDITGNVATTGTLTNNGVDVGNTHTHTITQSGVTDPPNI